MKAPLLVIALLFSFHALCQDISLAATGKDRRLQIGVSFSPDYCDRILVNNDNSDIAAVIIDLRDNSEAGKIGLTTGLNLSYAINRRFGIEAGLLYSDKGYSFKATELFYGDQVDPRYNFPYDSTAIEAPSKIKLIYSFHYLDIPVRLFFISGEKRIKFIASLGVTTNIFLNATQTNILEYEDGEKERVTREQPYDFEPVNITPTISAGIVYKISNAFDLRLEPTFRYGLLKIIDSRVSTRLWNAGVSFSCYYSLK